MNRRRVGRTALSVSVLGFGGAPVGNLYAEVSDEDAQASVAAAWSVGVRYYDTAPHYGLGLSERRLGVALAAQPRDDFVLSSKVGRVLEPNPNPSGSDLGAGRFAVSDKLRRRFDFSSAGVHQSLDGTLRRLGLDRLDIVLLHDPDDHVDQALAEAVPELVSLRDQGVVSAIGIGTSRWQTAQRFIRETDIDVVMLAGRWTLLDRSAEALLDECTKAGVSVLAAGPFNSGLLSQEWPSAEGRYEYGSVPTGVLTRARSLANTCRAANVPLPAAALQFALRHPAVASVVVGMRAPLEVRSDASWLNMPITQELWEQL